MSSDGVHIIFYINLFLLCGVSLRHFFKRLAAIVPYTVLLMLIGGVLGVVAIVISPDRNTATECEQLAALGNASGSLALVSGSGSGSVAMTSGSGSSGSGSVEWAVTIADAHFLTVMKVVANLDPHMLLYIFLPALLFESAQARARSRARAHATSCRSCCCRCCCTLDFCCCCSGGSARAQLRQRLQWRRW